MNFGAVRRKRGFDQAGKGRSYLAHAKTQNLTVVGTGVRPSRNHRKAQTGKSPSKKDGPPHPRVSSIQESKSPMTEEGETRSRNGKKATTERTSLPNWVASGHQERGTLKRSKAKKQGVREYLEVGRIQKTLEQGSY